jgi:hypothetical protein
MYMGIGPFTTTWTEVSQALGTASLRGQRMQIMTILQGGTWVPSLLFDHQSFDAGTQTFNTLSLGGTNLNFIQYMQVSNVNGTYQLVEFNQYIVHDNKRVPVVNSEGIGAYSPWGDQNSNWKFTYYGRFIGPDPTPSPTSAPTPVMCLVIRALTLCASAY